MLVTEADGPTSTPLVLLHPIHLPAYLHTGISFTRCGFGQRDRRRHETEPLAGRFRIRGYYENSEYT
jgi:hypothetical protein